MKRMLRFGVLVTVFALTSWLAQPQSGQALQSCSSLGSSCSPLGATVTCLWEEDDIRECECISGPRGRLLWLCYN